MALEWKNTVRYWEVNDDGWGIVNERGDDLSPRFALIDELINHADVNMEEYRNI